VTDHFCPPLREPVSAPTPSRDIFGDPSLTLTESRIAATNLTDLVASLGITGLRFSRGTYKLTITRGTPLVIEADTLTECVTRAHELHLTRRTTQEAA
jgi:hypothetical protein